MAKWSGNKVNPGQINNGNEYTVNDNVSIEELNGIVNNSLKAQEDAERALELATGANEANGTVVKINGEPQGTWDATFSQELYEESANEWYTKDKFISDGGIVFEIKDGVVYCSGTSTSGYWRSITLDKPLKSGRYAYKMFQSGTKPSNRGWDLRTSSGETVNLPHQEEGFVTIPIEVVSVRIYMTEGYSFENYVMKPVFVEEQYGIPKTFNQYNPNRHITNRQADFLKSENDKSSNEFNAKLLNGVKGIVVTDNGRTITMPIKTSGTGDVGTTYKLKELCPNMIAGETYFLNFTRSYNDGSNYIYLAGSKSFWNNNTSRTITQAELDGTVSIYANRYSSGYTEQMIMSDFAINKGTQKLPYQDWNGKLIHEKDITPVLLWKNATPNATIFTAQQMDLIDNIKNYIYFYLGYRVRQGNGYAMIYKKIKVADFTERQWFNISVTSGQTKTLTSREFFIESSGTAISVNSAYRDGTENNEYIIPYEIVGSNY